jgi:translation initiation factor 1 (eIF-1/SUI1)
MDLFLTEQNNNNNIFKDDKIIVFGEKNGKHYNTYIVGWDELDEKKMLEKLKKRFGCGGAIKKINYEGKEDTKVINIQGNFVIKTGEFLKTLQIKNLIIKELVQ